MDLSYDNITYSDTSYKAVQFKPNLRIKSYSTNFILPDSRYLRDIKVVMTEPIYDHLNLQCVLTLSQSSYYSSLKFAGNYQYFKCEIP